MPRPEFRRSLIVLPLVLVIAGALTGCGSKPRTPVDPTAIEVLRDYVSRVSDLDCQGAFRSPLDALAWLRTHDVDFVFSMRHRNIQHRGRRHH